MAYALRQQAGALLFDGMGGKRQKFRVCHCGRSVKGDVVTVFRAPDGSRARFSGTITCGSGWTCPICAFRLAGIRQKELQEANEGWVKAGGIVHLLTLTFPHEFDWVLDDLMADFDKARQKWRNSAAYKRILGTGKGVAGCIGTVASLEVTHGENGWHPHLHMLSFQRRALTVEEVETLTKAWVNCLLKVGLGDKSKLSDMMRHALDVRGGEDAAAYITKYGREEQWGMSREMTADVAKEAKGEHAKPFGLLRASLDGDTRAGALFKEFAEAFHGKRLLTWSPGLREWFGLGDERDEAEDVEEADASDATQKVGLLTPEQWKIVLSRNALADLEHYAAYWCDCPETAQDDLNAYIERLAQTPKRSGGWFMQPMQRRPIW